MRVKKSGDDPQATRKRILNSAKREFAQRGYSGAKVDSIARGAEANPALVHYYFGSKERLYVELLQKMLAVEISPIIDERVDRWNLTPSERLYVHLYLFVYLMIDFTDTDTMKIITREFVDEQTHFMEIIKEFILPRLERVERDIREGVESGEFSTSSPLLEVMKIFGFHFIYMDGMNLFSGTEFSDRVYKNMTKDEIFNFVLHHTFKALMPEKQKLKLPRLKEEIRSEMEILLKELQEIQKWD